jgi:hypothetical protein
MKTAAQAAARWQAGAGGAQTAYTDGITGTTIDVMARATAALPVAAQNYAASIASGATARAIAASGGTANWKAKAVAKAANYGVGISAGAPAYNAAMGKLMPFMEQTVNSLPARIPGNVMANVQNRVGGLVAALHANKGAFKG